MELATVKQVAARYPVFSEQAIRRLLMDRERNGLRTAVIRTGRRLYIDVAAFDGWLNTQREQAA